MIRFILHQLWEYATKHFSSVVVQVGEDSLPKDLRVISKAGT
jgi:hypothetical protein